ncbi:MAG: DUF4405 domain-containing protein [candidate division FCPU426 bacterium]
MASHPEQPFNSRAFAALTLALAALGLPVTGYVNHLLAFDPMSGARHAWMAAHNVLGVLFVVFGLWHLVLNWRPLLKHARGIYDRIFALSREAVWAGVVVGLALLVFVGHAFLLR